MKNSKMALVLATSVASVSAYITNHSISLPIAKFYVVEVSVNDTSDNGNMLHKIIKNPDDENLEIAMQVRCKLGASAKEMKDAIKEFPYNQFPPMFASKLYVEAKYINVDQEVEEALLTDLEALLSGKDNDGKTPLDLLKENPALVDMVKDVESFVQKERVEFAKNKEAILEQRMRDQQVKMARLLSLFNK